MRIIRRSRPCETTAVIVIFLLAAASPIAGGALQETTYLHSGEVSTGAILRGKAASQVGEPRFGGYATGGGEQIYVPDPSVVRQLP